MITWMLWSTGFVALLCVAAFASERVAGVFGVARRQVWMVALVAGAVVPPLLATRTTQSPEPVMTLVEEFPAPNRSPGEPVRYARPPVIRREPPRPQASAAPVNHRAENRAAIALWALASLVLATVFARTMLRLRRESAGWPEITVGSHRALLAPDAGPAVIGFAKPRIVIPEWALSLDEQARELMLRHEAEHIRVRDPRTLVIAGMLLTMFPWNAAMWLMVRQLRRAMEFDCDARVIRAVGNASEYGRVLLTVGERFTSPLPLAASLSAPRPLLEQRIDVMTTPRSPHPMRAALPFVVMAFATTTATTRAPRPAPLGPLAFAPVRAPSSHPASQFVPRDYRVKLVPRARDEDPVALAKSNSAAARIDSQTDVPAAPKGAPPTQLDREAVLAVARANFPAVINGDVPAKFLVLVFGANDQYLWGFPATSTVMVRVEGDTLTAQQRHAVQTARGTTVASDGTSGRGGRGGRGDAPPAMGATNTHFNASGTLSSARENTYINGYGMTATKDSAGVFHFGAVNKDAGLFPLMPAGGESGIAGVPAKNVMFVDDFALHPDDRFATRLQILAVHLTAASIDGIEGARRAPPNAPPRDFEVRKDTDQVPDKKKATVKTLKILPMPMPAIAKPYAMTACFEVAPSGNGRLLTWNPSRDTSYNAKIRESLSHYEFNAATRNGVAVQDTVCVHGTGG